MDGSNTEVRREGQQRNAPDAAHDLIAVFPVAAVGRSNRIDRDAGPADVDRRSEQAGCQPELQRVMLTGRRRDGLTEGCGAACKGTHWVILQRGVVSTGVRSAGIDADESS